MKKTKYLYSILIIILFVFCLTFSACKKDDKITINFESDGGTKVSSIVFESVNSFRMPITSKDGSNFDGWFYDDKSFDKPFSIDSITLNPPTKSLTVYAKWSSRNITHIFGEWQLLPDATCITDGSRKKSCSECGETIVETIEAFGHKYKVGKIIPPSCVLDGSKQNVCSLCGDIETEVILQLGHTYGEFDNNITPTCTEGAVKNHTCKTCHVVETVTVSALGHSWVVDIDVDEFVTEECSVCHIKTEPIMRTLDYKLKKDDTYEVTGIGILSGDVSIPEKYRGKCVTSIKEEAFKSNNKLTHITLPSSITSIGVMAFFNCKNLKEINVDKNNPNYQSSTDKNLYNKDGTTLIQYAIGKSANYDIYAVPGTVRNIGTYAFANSTLKECVILYGVVNVGSYAFWGCTNLKTVRIAISVLRIGESTFPSATTVYSEAVSKPIDWSEKWNNNSTKPVIWKFNNKTDNQLFGYVEQNRFVSLTRYKGGDTVVEIPRVLGERNKEIRNIGQVFRQNTMITEVKIPDTVDAICENAFDGCRELTKVIIPLSIKTIDSRAFSGMDGLTVYAYAEDKPTGWVENWKASNVKVVWNFKG